MSKINILHNGLHMNNNQQNWYLVFTKVKAERKAQEHLNRQGYSIYLPMTQKKIRRNGKYIYTTEPFFPRYMFIKLNTDTDNWSPIRSTIGVACIVRFGGVPAIVPEGLIDALRIEEDAIGLQPVVEKKLSAGEKITVIDGPFAGYQGICQQIKGSERVAILLDIVGRNTQVVLSVHDLQIA